MRIISRERISQIRQEQKAAGVLGLLLALASVLLAGCGSPPTLYSTRPIWTPGAATAMPAQTADWPVFGFDAARSEMNPNAMSLTPATVGGLHRLWSVSLPQAADSTPVLLRNVTLPDGTRRDVLYLTTLAGSLVAVDAATGAQLWSATPKGSRITNSSPAADPAHGLIYSYGLDGKLHRYRAATGQEVAGNGWPVTITDMPASEKESSALNVANGYVYVTTSGYVGDAPPYQGHVVAINLATGATQVFNSLCSNVKHILARGECPNNGSGIWSRAGAVVDPVTGNIFITTGNGLYNGNQGGHDWGDSMLELSGDGNRLVDSYTPTNFDDLDQTDTDLGSASPALLPTIPHSTMPYLAVQGGKDGLLRLLDRQNLSGQGGPGHVGGELQAIDAPGGCATLTQPAVWTDPSNGAIWLFVTNSCGTSGYQVVTAQDGTTTLEEDWNIQRIATSPVVAGGVLFAATSGEVFALDPHTGRQLWSSTGSGAGGSIGSIHWESPIVIDARLYCTDESGYLTAYGL